MLMPSELESFGLAALEAMACGVPTIATSVGGVPELIEDGVTGCLFPVGDVEGMSQCAIDLLKDQRGWKQWARPRARPRRTTSAPRASFRSTRVYYEQVLAQDAR